LIANATIKESWCPCEALLRVELLSERQRELLTWMHDGPTNRKLAARLAISEETAKGYLADIFRKLEIDSRVQAGIIGFLLSRSLTLACNERCNCAPH
jgi:DNA-binding CsgD family transcriptional regulator